MKRTFLAMIAVAALALPMWAQEEGDDPQHQPARISLMNGDVSVRQGDAGEPTAASMNAPLLAGDRLLTAEGSRAEVQFDAVNFVRLAPMTELRMGDIEYRHYIAQVGIGTVMVHVARDNDAQFEIGTPSISVRPSKRGDYRITVEQDGSTTVTVRVGETEIFTPRGSEVLKAGKSMHVRGDAADPEFQVSNAIPQDDFDKWNVNRNTDLDRSVSSRYVPSDVYGTESLDANGQWIYDAPYGYVWVPNVDPGWAPYRVGRWSYMDPYGWTWISGDPWGWAPYHYGRWYQGSRGWAWYPGAFGSRYYWRPALVGFFGWGGGGGGIGIGFGFGNFGWVPLAPYEVYRPWYGRGFAGRPLVTNVNITNVYRNARFDNGRSGITSVRAGDFGRGSINNSNFVRANENDLRRGGEVRGAVPFTPTAQSRRMSDRTVNARAFPTTNNNRFYSREAGRSVPTASTGTRTGPTFGGGAVNTPQDRGAGRQNNATPNNGTPEDRGGNRRGGENGAAAAGNPVRGGAENNVPSRRDAVQGGAQGPANNPANTAPNANVDRGGWRRFDPATANQQRGQGGAARVGGESRVPNNGGAPRVGGESQTRPQVQENRGGPRGNPGPQGGGAAESPRNRNFSQPQPVRINPPMVQQRSAPDYGNRSTVMRGGPAPAPARQAAPPMRSAPAGGGGGGAPRGGGNGGGNRGGGGGGGGGGGHRGR